MNRLTVMVVDDNVTFLDLLVRLLKRHDFDASAFTTPQAALTAFRKSPGDWGAVITDQNMPGITGIELVRELRAIQPTVPCFICTAFAEQLNQDDVRAYGVKATFAKPLVVGEFINALAHCMKSGREERPSQ